ncbi:alpha/beta fold hydrolase [Paraburkholderia domus]|uniref:alpha/beta fold hydrolase n=1 Tax=Paraburkholderia domus TaxID=2793075 RepID=UPI0019120F7C|nr:alpha/beta hydrolase [Paraburkholderia domus]MBK5065917.1 alpha/beta hydrolase [Burkholderia sp. R-70199]CAE6959440.1 3-oxoadipate enol-lactonase 2 [Paraburkholderia domus]
MNSTNECVIQNGADEFLWCEATGQGVPVVFIHGFSFDASTWDLQFKALGGRYRGIRYDLRGFGRSSDPSGKYSHSEDLLAIFREFEIDSAYIVGLSLGANVALTFAIDHPARVKSLILASPGLPGFEWSDERPPDAARRHAAAYGLDAAKQFWFDHPMFASARALPAVASALRDLIARYRGWHWTVGANARAPASLIGELWRVRCPTLIVNGARDVKGYVDIGLVLFNEIANVKRVELEGVGHLVNMEAPERFNEAMLKFLDQCN